MNVDINVQVTNKKPSTVGEIAKVRVTIGGTIHHALLVRDVIGHFNLELDTVSKHLPDKVYKWEQIGKTLATSICNTALALHNEEAYRV